MTVTWLSRLFHSRSTMWIILLRRRSKPSRLSVEVLQPQRWLCVTSAVLLWRLNTLTDSRKFTYLEWKYKLEIVTCNALNFFTYFVIHPYMTSDNTSRKIFDRGVPRHKHKISRMCIREHCNYATLYLSLWNWNQLSMVKIK